MTSMPYQSQYDAVLTSFLEVHQERCEKRACLSLNFIPAGVFLLWALQKSLSGGN